MKNLLNHLQLYFPKVTIREEDDPLVESLLHRLELQEIPVEYQQVVIKEFREVLSELSPTMKPAPAGETLTEEPTTDRTVPKEQDAGGTPDGVSDQATLEEPETTKETLAEPDETKEPKETEDTTVTVLEAITQIVQQVQEHCTPPETFQEYRATYLTTVLQTATQLIFGETVPNEDHVTQCVTILQRTLQDMAANLEQAEFAWVFTVEEIPTIVDIVKTGLLRLVQPDTSQDTDEPSATVT
jgi:hypothetical protein